MSWTTCKHSTCPKAQECLRFTVPEGTIIDFQYICPNYPNDPYHYQWKVEKTIVPTKEKLET